MRLAAPVEAPASSEAGIPYSKLTVGVLKEMEVPNEQRVVQSPTSVGLLTKAGMNVIVESGAGAASQFSDADYVAAGAKIGSRDEAWKADIVAKIAPPKLSEAAKLQGRTLISLVYPQKNEALLSQLQKQGSTLFALDQIPRMLSRGQTFDVLSSQTNIIGYRAVVEAQQRFGRFFAGQMTAAGRVSPARSSSLPASLASLRSAAEMRARTCRRTMCDRRRAGGVARRQVPARAI